LAQDKHSSGHDSPFKPRQLIFYNEQNNECAKFSSTCTGNDQNSDFNEVKGDAKKYVLLSSFKKTNS